MEFTIGKTLQYSALGIGIVFALIIVLMIIVKIVSVAIQGAEAQSRKAAVQAAPPKAGAGAGTDGTAQSVETKTGPPAPGSAGDVKLFDVPDRDAAMIMAIVADKMGAPLNELRFLSIREVKEEGKENKR